MKYSLKKKILLVLSFIILCFGVGIAAIYFFGTPSVATIADFPLKQTTIFYDRTGTHELYRLYNEENRIVIGHGDIPDSVRMATVASEDANFYTHQGIDLTAVLRSLIVDILSGKISQGGSTITQQLARSLYLTRERTLERKVREMFLAVKIDSHFSKEQILDLYLNTVPYGSNAYGIETAAKTFFNKEARDLTLEESALLAALPNAPTYFSPSGDHAEELRQRQQNILKRMRELHLISKQEMESALSTDILARIVPLKRPIVAPHFVFYVISQLEKTYPREKLETEGLKVSTTLDLDLQEAAELAVQKGVKKNLVRGASNAGLVALDPKTGQVLAMVGSKDYFDTGIDGNVNITIQARQPGSAFKPFAYAAAFEAGYQPETPIVDRPIDFGLDGTGHPYIPENYDGQFHGLLTMRQTLAMSLNIPAVETLALAGIQNTVSLATRLGITTLTHPERYGLALVLGGAEVKPLDMASAFSVFGQDGIRHEITPVLKILDRHGEAYAESGKVSDGVRVLDAPIAQKINSILSDNAARTPIFGPNSPLAFPRGVVVAAKTGTTQNFRDAWTVGYTPSIATAVWAGNNNNQPMVDGADGIFTAAPIWRDFMNTALEHFPQTGFTPYVENSALPPTNALLTDGNIIYLDKKTGRKVSAKKAKRLKEGRVEKRAVNNVFPDGISLEGTSPNNTIPFEALRPTYTPTPPNTIIDSQGNAILSAGPPSERVKMP